jgi:hypothetical protein
MEPLAQKTVETSCGDVTVRAFTFEDLTTLSQAANSALATLAQSEDGVNGNAMLTMSTAVISGVQEVLTLCSSLKEKELKKLPVHETVRVFNAWLDVSKWEETAELFFGIVNRMKTAVPKKEETQK